MNVQSISISIFLSLTMVGSVSARIGETLVQCQKRYGKETGTHKEYTHFEHDGLRLSCSFDEQGRCDSIHYMKMGPEGSHVFQPADLEKLMEIYRRGGEWELVKRTEKSHLWVNQQAGLTMHHFKKMHFVRVF